MSLTIGRFIFTDHAIDRFRSRYAPDKTYSEIVVWLKRLEPDATRLRERTFAGDVRWKAGELLMVVAEANGKRVVVTVLPKAEIEEPLGDVDPLGPEDDEIDRQVQVGTWPVLSPVEPPKHLSKKEVAAVPATTIPKSDKVYVTRIRQLENELRQVKEAREADKQRQAKAFKDAEDQARTAKTKMAENYRQHAAHMREREERSRRMLRILLRLVLTMDDPTAELVLRAIWRVEPGMLEPGFLCNWNTPKSA